MTTVLYRCYGVCGKSLPEEAYYKVSGRPSRPVSGKCKSCTSAYNKSKGRKAAKARKGNRNPQYQDAARKALGVVNMMRSAAQRGATIVEPIELDAIYTRDKGICQECQQPCSRGEASCGHIVPVSKGGQHVWANVQLEHLRCNVKKGNRVS